MRPDDPALPVIFQCPHQLLFVKRFLRKLRGNIVVDKHRKIVLCRRYDGALGLDFDWLDQGDARVLADPVEYHAINDGQYLAVQDRYHYAVADKWPAVRYTLENCEAGRDVF